MAVGNSEIEEIIAALPNINRAESVESIELIEEILTYDNYDYVIVNALLSPRKVAKLADFIENSLDIEIKPKIIILVENLNDKKFIAQLVGLGVNAFLSFEELSLIGRYMESYPKSFNLGVIADENKKADITATRVINGTISIGIFNLDNGAGSTTYSLKLAQEIANCGYKVICMEIDQDNFSCVKKIPKTLELISATNKEKDAILQAAYGDNSYQFIIIDFGKIFSIDKNNELLFERQDCKGDFFRCNYKIGMCFASPWHTKKMDMFLKNSFFTVDIAKNQLFLLICGLGYKEAIEDYHELCIWERNSINEFIECFRTIIGINSTSKSKRKLGFLKRR